MCVWVYDGEGNLLLTRRAPGKSYAGTWENSGGVAKAGETSLQAIRRELPGFAPDFVRVRRLAFLKENGEMFR